MRRSGGVGAPARVSSRACVVLCAALVALAGAPALAVDLIGRDRAALAWAPASGEVSAYVVFVSRNGGPYRSEQYTREPRTVVSGSAGETLHVRVRAYSVADGLTFASTASDASEPIRFLPREPAAAASLAAVASAPAAVASAPAAAAPVLADKVRRIPGFQFAQRIGVEAHGDFDGDGDLDLLVTLGSWQHPLALFLEGGSLEHAVCLAPLGAGSSALAADFDGDGRDELALRAAGQLTVVQLERNGHMKAIRREEIASSARLVAADLDGDSAASLVMYEPASGRLTERFAKQNAVDFGSIRPLHALHAGDFDGDGLDDLWVQSAPGPNAELWLMREGGSFAVAPLSLDRHVATFTIADLNGDSRADIAGYDAVRGELRAWLLDGDRVIGQRPIASGPLETLRSGDLDGDGVDDLLLVAPGGAASALLLER